MDHSVLPVAQPLRRLPFATLTRVEEKLNELLNKDIIEKVTGPSRWVSPMVVVVKDNGDIRLCLDMRQLNKAVIRETHPLPTIEDIRWKLNGAVFFTRLDIKDAFHQLELDEVSKPLTTFITHKDNPGDDDGSDTEDFRGFPDESGNNDASPSPSTAVVDIGKRNKRQRKITMPKRFDDCLMKF
ncbi:uncharacterized protein K02A2.6-like [Uranotaenia lowii]|uniref:uncharacterized protein K02A2.6-like n=1 Tax=Uranotaenia lowii TaxID=190385 RepID=UPI0024788056|nr:uncharacterized protein K02A2.6-like [Uranotaenia lowii]